MCAIDPRRQPENQLQQMTNSAWDRSINNQKRLFCCFVFPFDTAPPECVLHAFYYILSIRHASNSLCSRWPKYTDRNHMRAPKRPFEWHCHWNAMQCIISPKHTIKIKNYANPELRKKKQEIWKKVNESNETENQQRIMFRRVAKRVQTRRKTRSKLCVWSRRQRVWKIELKPFSHRIREMVRIFKEDPNLLPPNNSS